VRRQHRQGRREVRGVWPRERQKASAEEGRSMTDQGRIGHVYYWSLIGELILVVSSTPALLETGDTMWECYSLETVGRPTWLSERDISYVDGMFVRVA